MGAQAFLYLSTPIFSCNFFVAICASSSRWCRMSRFLTSNVKWAAGGWTFFIAENFILSENRSYIITQLGDDNYHYLYGLCSTAAVGSIAYGYQYKVKNQGPMLWKLGSKVPPSGKILSFACLACGFGLLSQTAPKLQIPLEIIAGESLDKQQQEQRQKDSGNNNKSIDVSNAGSSKWKVRCP